LGTVADYFAYRERPDLSGGLALLEAHWSGAGDRFELACGIGHYARELTRRGVACLGADVVFAKCWVAKHWVAPDADFVCFDAAATLAHGSGGSISCIARTAFTFLPDQERVAERMLGGCAGRQCWPWGTCTTLRLRVRAWASQAGGEWRALFPDATL
jgi:hypothetical protein